MIRVHGWRGVAVIAMVCITAACSSADPGGDAGPTTSRSPGPTAPSADRIAELQRAAGLAPCPSTQGEPSSRSDLPAVELACLGGGPDVAVAGLVGTPYVVNFWASWCTECVEEVPYLQEVADVAAGRFQVLGVNFLDAEEGALLAAPDFGLRYPSLFDPEGKLGEAFPVPGLPVTFFVDTDGSIVGTQTGPFDSADDLRDAIEQELGVRL